MRRSEGSPIESRVVEARALCHVCVGEVNRVMYTADTVIDNIPPASSNRRVGNKSDRRKIVRSVELDGHFVIRSHRGDEPSIIRPLIDESIAHSLEEANEKMLSLALEEAKKLAIEYGLSHFTHPNNYKIPVDE